MNTIPVRVAAASVAAQDIRLLQLAALDGRTLPAYDPGSHIDLHLGPALVRQYSLCGPQDDGSSYTVAVKREPMSRGGSKAVHDELAVGSTLQISAPRNNFPMALAARRTLLLAGGIGITPLIGMARALHAQGQSFELLYFCRSAAHAAFQQELESAEFAPYCRFHFGLDEPAVAAVLRQTLADPQQGSHLYLCGPTPFMRAVQDVAADAQWPEACVHLEYFSAPAPTGDASNEAGFDLKLARTGISLNVPAGETMIDVLRRNGVDVQTSCEQGVCGTCVTGVLEGTPDHRDCFLTPAEKARGDCVVVCVSRSASPLLVLDL